MKQNFSISAWRVKNQAIFYFSAIVLMTSILGCSKEDNLLDEHIIKESEQLNALSLLTNGEFAENNQVNQILYLFGKAIQNMAQNPTLLYYMERHIDNDRSGFGVSIMKLASTYPDLGEEISNHLLTILEEEKITIDDFDNSRPIESLTSLMLCRGKTYEPVLYRLNKNALMARNQDVIVAIAEEVTDSDEVLAFRNNEDIPFLLSEEMAMNTTDRIIFVGVGDIPDDEGIIPVIIDEGITTNYNNGSMRVDIDIDADRHQIKNGYRYENSNKSEVRCWITKFGLGNWSIQNWQDFDP
jgi:hypothetical protein